LKNAFLLRDGGDGVRPAPTCLEGGQKTNGAATRSEDSFASQPARTRTT
jgi:hypothetical protein